MPELQGTATLRQIIGANLEKARRDMQLSQQAFGARLIQWLPTAWSPQAVSLAERGNRAFGADDLLALSVGLRVPVPYFLMPPPEVQMVVTASGMVELPREQFVDEVVGTGASRSQLERARLAGRAEAFEEMAALLNERRHGAQSTTGDSAEQLLPLNAYKDDGGFIGGKLYVNIPKDEPAMPERRGD